MLNTGLERERDGNELRIIMSGLKTLTAEMPTPDFAIPYPAPKLESVIAIQHPIAPKNDYLDC